MANTSESTGLISGEPKYRLSRPANILYRRHQHVRQFQCCICAILLCLAGVLVVFAVSYGLNRHISDEPNNTEVLLALSWPIPDKPHQGMCVNDFNDLQDAILIGKEELNKKDILEDNLPSLSSDKASFRHQKVFVSSHKSKLLARMGYVQEVAQKHLQNTINMSTICNDSNSWLLDLNENKSRVVCDKYKKYRTYDGTCNNFNHPLEFGVAFTPFRRSLPPDYADGISEPRIAKTHKQLPSARNVSETVHRPIYTNDKKFTVMLAVWGQFIDHDITATAPTRGKNGSTIPCCPYSLHPECFQVLIDENDPYFGKFNVTCLDFVRSASAQTNKLGPREQLNQATSFLDGSAIYGNEQNITNELRTFEEGKMKMYVTPDNRTLLPILTEANDGCNEEEQNKIGKYCFLTGDQRANENLHLTSMHLIWVRQHNRLASQLKNINKHWDDETIFQEARRIVGAQIQHITYNEFLPILFGKKLMEKADILLTTDDYYKNYDETTDASIANNFATAAFRFGHTLIPELVKFLNNSNLSFEYIQMRKMLFNPYSLYKEDGLDESLRSAITTKAHASDTYFNIEVKQHLFEKSNTNQTCGLDLVSLNIQRGRDHGLPGYIKWREHCGFPQVTNFKQLKREMDQEALKRIQRIYENVEDIDLYTGALSEIPLPEGIIGPTMTCLLLDQFVRLKIGDRMWYENINQSHPFTLAQLKEIRSTTLAEIICNNSDSLDEIQTFVMEQVRSNNKYVPCKSLAIIDINKWKENPRIVVSVSSSSANVKIIN